MTATEHHNGVGQLRLCRQAALTGDLQPLPEALGPRELHCSGWPASLHMIKHDSGLTDWAHSFATQAPETPRAPSLPVDFAPQ